MSKKKISFAGDSIDFEEWLTPGGSEPNKIVAPIMAEESGEEYFTDSRLFFQSFGSGSSGNSCYVGTAASGLLIDAGVREDAVESNLKSNGISMDKVKGILLTHDHSDHVKYVYKLLRNHKGISLFCTNRVMNGILRHHNVSRRIKDYHIPIFKEIPFKVGDFEVTAFEVSHDASDSMGFHLKFKDKEFVLATDMGGVTSRAYNYISRAQYLVVEANYDLQMLMEGPYPEHLKARILTANGHMDNDDTANLLKQIYNKNLRHVFLCHLSKENNTPTKARVKVKEALESLGVRVGAGDDSIADRESDLSLVALPRLEPSRWYVFH